MKIRYETSALDDQKRNLFIADLLGYKIQRDLEATRKLKAISGDSRTLTAIVNVARRSSSATGMTIETVLSGIETALAMDIFSFKVNGIDLFRFVMDELNKNKTFELEVYMNPLYFSSEIALKGAVMPGFRKKSVDEDYINQRVHRAEMSWMFNFEKDIKEYIDIGKCKKTVMEETV